MMTPTVEGLETCTAAGVVFQLVDSGDYFQWVFPDGSRTGLDGLSRDEVRRQMVFRVLGLAEEWNTRHPGAESGL